MNSKTIIMTLIILVINLVTHFTYAMKMELPLLPPRRHSTPLLKKVPVPVNHDIFVISKDPHTKIQIQHATEEYSRDLARCFIMMTTIRMSDYPKGRLCVVQQQAPISFYESFSNKKINIETTDEFDEFTIHPEENGSIIITKKNDYTKSITTEVARFTLKHHS